MLDEASLGLSLAAGFPKLSWWLQPPWGSSHLWCYEAVTGIPTKTTQENVAQTKQGFGINKHPTSFQKNNTPSKIR
jgi:hypothetical protein